MLCTPHQKLFLKNWSVNGAKNTYWSQSELCHSSFTVSLLRSWNVSLSLAPLGAQLVESECSLAPQHPCQSGVKWAEGSQSYCCREVCDLSKLTLHLALPFKKLGPRSEQIQPPTSAKGSRRGRRSAWPSSLPHTSLSQHPGSQPTLSMRAIYFPNTWGRMLSSCRVTGRRCLQQS